MGVVKFKDIYDPVLAEGAIINDRMEGFREDYLTLHCLLRKYNPKSVFEVGTHVGWGTKIIKNAVPEAKVYSLDLPDSEASVSLQHPISEGKAGVGVECDLSFIQLRGDSRLFNYGAYPCEAYWVDAEHKYNNVYAETTLILKCKPKIIIYHDTDIPEVLEAIMDALEYTRYEVVRVQDTRVSYCIKKQA